MMSGLMIKFFKKHALFLISFIVIAWVLIFSFHTLTTNPKLWTDESINIELARNFSLSGKLDVIVSPGVFSGYQPLLQSTGYPVTLPLALFFKIFGFGLVQARVYMVIWMIAVLLMVIFLVRKMFGAPYAAWSLLLIATLAPFYGNGRCVMGEIPGFLFLLVGVYLLWFKNTSIFISGIFFGLAVVSKPSIYLLLVPAIWLSIFLQRDGFFKRFLTVSSGMVLPLLFWIIIVMPSPFLISEWTRIFSFYKNPFGEISVWGNVIKNLYFLPSYSTLVYFFILFVAVLAAIFLNRNFYNRYKNFINFIIIYCALAFIYFLKSPGWLRYIIAGQLLIFLVFPYSLATVFSNEKFKKERLKKFLFYGILLSLVLFQLWHLIYRADLFYSDIPQAISEFINAQSVNKTVGIINLPQISSLIDPSRKFQTIKMLGLPVFGENPLSLETEKLPDFIIANSDDDAFKEYEGVVKDHYRLVKSFGAYNIYNLSI